MGRVVGRVERIEREVGAAGVEREYSLYQLLTSIDLESQGKTPEEIEAIVGPPEVALVPGVPGLMDLLVGGRANSRPKNDDGGSEHG